MTWREARAEDMSLAGVWALAAASAVALAPVLRLASGLLPACPLHALTGLPCPSCGATRAALQLADGQVLDALAINPLATLALGLAIMGGLLAPAWVALRGPLPARTPDRILRQGVVAALAINWAYLVLHGV